MLFIIKFCVTFSCVTVAQQQQAHVHQHYAQQAQYAQNLQSQQMQADYANLQQQAQYGQQQQVRQLYNVNQFLILQNSKRLQSKQNLFSILVLCSASIKHRSKFKSERL